MNNTVEKTITTFPEMRVLVLLGDLYGCRLYRIRLPHIELKRYNVTTHEIAFLPNVPGLNNFKVLIDEFSKYDLVIIQRCYLREIVNTVRKVCDFLGIPLVFETDDDYLHIPMDNPAYLSMIAPEIIQANTSNPQKLEELRQQGLNNYKEIINMMDLVLVSTEELKRTLLPYNKNIEVLQNNIEEVFPYRTFDPESYFVKDGKVKINNHMGMISTPAYIQINENTIKPTPRIGWTSTITHWGQDFETIRPYWEKVIEKYSTDCWFLYLGWEKFALWHNEYAGYKLTYTPEGPTWIQDEKARRQLPQRVLHIPDAMYDLYLYHIRNLDIGIAPLSPNIFNMSKSDIKPIEYAAWGIPAVLPKYITYTRNWEHEKNCLIYQNGKEFQECLDALITDHSLRSKLGEAAKEYVRNNRLEKQHSLRRYTIYCNTINSKHRLRAFKPISEVPDDRSK